MAEKQHTKFRPPQANNSTSAVSVIPSSGPRHRHPTSLQQIFRVTTGEYLALKFFASAPRAVDCTPRQRLLFRKLEQRGRATEIEYPCP